MGDSRKPSCGAACANTSCPGCPARDGGGSRGLVPGGFSATYWRNCREEPRLQAGGGESVKTGFFWVLLPGRLHPEEGKELQEPCGNM